MTDSDSIHLSDWTFSTDTKQPSVLLVDPKLTNGRSTVIVMLHDDHGICMTRKDALLLAEELALAAKTDMADA